MSETIKIELDKPAPTEPGYYAFQCSPGAMVNIVYMSEQACRTALGREFTLAIYPNARWSRRIEIIAAPRIEIIAAP